MNDNIIFEGEKKKIPVKFIIFGIVILVGIICLVLLLGNDNKKYVITLNDTRNIKYQKYDNGLVSLNLPEGWVFEEATGKFNKYLYYTFTAYDKDNTDYWIFVSLKTEGYARSQEIKDTFKNVSSIYSLLPLLKSNTANEFYLNFNDSMNYFFGSSINLPKISDFSVSDSVGTNLTGGDILRANYKNEDGKTVDGIFSATIENSLLYEIPVLTVFDAVFFTTSEGKLIEWMPVFDKIIGSIKFSNKFLNEYEKASKEINSVVVSNKKKHENLINFADLSKNIDENWKASDSLLEIEIQKIDDYNMGYERVYNKRNGNIYKANYGFTKNGKNGKYLLITNDMYKLPTMGFIEEKKK